MGKAVAKRSRKWAPKTLTGQQMRVVQLWMRNKHTCDEIGKMTGYSRTHVERILASPGAKKMIAKWRENMRYQTQRLLHKSIDVIEQELVSGPDKLTAVEKAIKLYKVTHPEEENNEPLQTTINIFERLRAQIEEKKEENIIDGEFEDVSERRTGAVGDSASS